MTTANICLTRCIEFSPYSNDTACEDVRLAQVHAVLASQGVQAIIDDHKLEDLSTVEQLVQHAKHCAARQFVLVVLFVRQRSSGIHFTRRWVQLLRQHLSAGHQPIFALAGDTSVGYSPLLKEGIVDVVLQGDEDTVGESIIALASGKPAASLLGAIFLEDGHLRRIAPPLSPFSLDRLPHPTLYAAQSEAVRSGRLGYLPHLRATRGCYARCSFCHESVSYFESATGRHRHTSVAWIAEDVQRVVDEGAREIMFQDSNFLPHPSRGDDWLVEFLEMMGRRFPTVAFAFWTRAQDLTSERVRLLRSSRLSYVLIGIESLIDARLQRMRKGVKAHQIREAVRLLQDAGIEGKLSFILFDPESTIESLSAELNEIDSLFRDCPDVQRNPIFAWNILTPHPDTPLYQEYVSRNLLRAQRDQSVEEHFSFMASRLIGSDEVIDAVSDDTLAVLCEAFRLYQYEYSKKWYAALQHNRSTGATLSQPFFHRLPQRMVHVLQALASYAANNQHLEPKTLQADLTAILYNATKADYARHLPLHLRTLETPHTVNYAEPWAALMPLGSLA